MTLARILRDTTVADFVDRYLHRIPLSQPGGARDFVELATWEALERILGGAAPVDLVVVRANRRHDGPPPHSIAESRALFAQGWTLLVRHAERNDPGLAELARGFRADLASEIDVHLYVTPPGAHGFGWHFDAEDVFVLQTAGAKTFSIRKNTVHPWPLLETMTDDLGFEHERTPLVRCELAAGDALYIPNGYWHRAETGPASESISLAVGAHCPSAVLLLDFLRRVLPRDIVWRRRLPLFGEASPLDTESLLAQYRELLTELGGDLARTLAEPKIARAFLDSLRPVN